MPFRFTFRVDYEEAMTVPYAAISDDIRRNRGSQICEVNRPGRRRLPGEVAPLL